LREPGPPADAQPLLQIELIDRGDDEQHSQSTEIKQLALENIPVFFLHGVVEARIPLVELHVKEDRGEFEKNNGYQQNAAGPSILAHEIGDGETANIGEKSEDRAQG